MMRQESSFDPRAQSGAQAMGLTQVVPPTARSIASRLGRDDFALRDLFKPAVSVEFGTWFLSQLLGDYKGRVFPALAAYNAGGGNVATLAAALRRRPRPAGRTDPVQRDADVLADRVRQLLALSGFVRE